MPTFRYKAATPNGKVLEGEMEAIDLQAMVSQLQADGQIPIHAEEGVRRASIRDELNSILSRRTYLSRTAACLESARSRRVLGRCLPDGIANQRPGLKTSR